MSDSPPNAVTGVQRAHDIRDQLNSVQRKRDELLMVQEINGVPDTDPVPNVNPKMDPEKPGEFLFENGQLVFPTYAEKAAEYDGAIARAWAIARREGVAGLVETLIKADHANAAVEIAATAPVEV